MITKPMLKPMRGYVEVEVNGRRMYKNVKTGEIVAPSAATSVSEPTAEQLLDAFMGVTNYE